MKDKRNLVNHFIPLRLNTFSTDPHWEEGFSQMEEWQIPMSVLISNSGDDCSQDQTGMMNKSGIIRNTQMHVSLDPELHSSVPHVFLNGPSELYAARS